MTLTGSTDERTFSTWDRCTYTEQAQDGWTRRCVKSATQHNKHILASVTTLDEIPTSAQEGHHVPQ